MHLKELGGTERVGAGALPRRHSEGGTRALLWPLACSGAEASRFPSLGLSFLACKPEGWPGLWTENGGRQSKGGEEGWSGHEGEGVRGLPASVFSQGSGRAASSEAGESHSLLLGSREPWTPWRSRTEPRRSLFWFRVRWEAHGSRSGENLPELCRLFHPPGRHWGARPPRDAVGWGWGALGR